MPSSVPGRFHRFASLAVLPVMLLAILAFSRQAQRQPAPPPPSSGLLVVAGLRSDQLLLYDIAADRARSLALPAAPHELTDAGGRLYATLPRAGLLAEVDPAAPGLLRLLQLDGQPHGLAFDPALGTLYVTLGAADTLVALDHASLAAIASWPTGSTPHTIALAEGVPHITAARADRIEVIRPTGGPSLPTGRLPEAIVAVPGLIVAASYLDGTLSLARAVTLEPVAEIALGGGPVRILPIDADRVAVALQEAAAVAIVDVRQRQELRRLAVPARPDGLCLSPGGDYLAIASNAADTITVFETRSWRVAATIRAPHGPGACLWLPG